MTWTRGGAVQPPGMLLLRNTLHVFFNGLIRGKSTYTIVFTPKGRPFWQISLQSVLCTETDIETPL